MSLKKPKIPYVKTTAQSLLNYEIPIPKDAEIKMLSLINETKKLKKQYDSLNRKYNLKRAIRIQGKDHKEDTSKSSKLDIFGADKIEGELVQLGKDMARNLIDFAFLWDFFCKKTLLRAEDGKSILLKDYKIFGDFKNNYFGKNFEIEFNDRSFKNIKNSEEFDKKSIIYSMQSSARVIDAISDGVASESLENLVFSECEADRNGYVNGYVNFINGKYRFLSQFDDDEQFAEANHAVSCALEKAIKTQAAEWNETKAHITLALSRLSDVTRVHTKLNEDTQLISNCIDGLAPLIKNVGQSSTTAKFRSLRSNFKELANKVEGVDEDIFKAKSALKYFNKPTYGDINTGGIEATVKESVVSLKKEVISFVKRIKKGSKTKTIINRLKYVNKKMEDARTHVSAYRESKYYATTGYDFTVGDITSPPADVVEKGLSNFVQQIFSKSDKKNKQSFTKEYNAAVERIKRYGKKVRSYEKSLDETKETLKDLGNQISYYNSSSFKILKGASFAGKAVSTLVSAVSAIMILFG